MWETEQFWGFHSIFFPTIEVNGAPKQPGYKLSSKYLILCSAEQINAYRFETTLGWVNDDTICIFGWSIPLNGDRINFFLFSGESLWTFTVLYVCALLRLEQRSVSRFICENVYMFAIWEIVA